MAEEFFYAAIGNEHTRNAYRASVEGKTPEISVHQARRLLASINAKSPVARRDRAVLALLAYTAARAGAVAKLRRGDLQHRKVSRNIVERISI